LTWQENPNISLIPNAQDCCNSTQTPFNFGVFGNIPVSKKITNSATVPET